IQQGGYPANAVPVAFSIAYIACDNSPSQLYATISYAGGGGTYPTVSLPNQVPDAVLHWAIPPGCSPSDPNYDGHNCTKVQNFAGVFSYGSPTQPPFANTTVQVDSTASLVNGGITVRDVWNVFVNIVPVGPGPTPSNGKNDAVCDGLTAPATITAGEAFPVTVTLTNNGGSTWTSGGSNPYRLGSQSPQDNTTWGLGRVDLPTQPVSPGAQTTFSFTPTAPSQAGTYDFAWRMLQEGREWFGQTCGPKKITVAAA